MEYAHSAVQDQNLEDQNGEALTPFEQARRRGEELRVWQAQERAERLGPLSGPLDELSRRLLMAHPTWAVQNHIHLDYAGLEVSAHSASVPTLVECHVSEDLESQGTGAIEVTIAGHTGFRTVATPDAFENTAGRRSHVMEHLLTEVEREVVSQALIAPEGATVLAPRSFGGS